MSRTSSATPPQGEVDHGPILDWIEQLRATTKSARWRELLDFDGIDALDVLLAPIYLTVLNTLRRDADEPEPAATAVLDHVHDFGYRLKMGCRERRAAWRSLPARPSDVLLWSRDASHTVILNPIAAELERQQISHGLLACQPKIFDCIKSRNANATFTLGAWPEVVRRARREGARRAKELAALDALTFPEFPQAPTSAVASVVRGTVIRFLPLVSETVANARAALDMFQPKVLVVGNDITLEGRTGCRVAASRGVLSAMFMHGSLAGDTLHSMHCADRVFVYGDVQRQALMHQGMGAERIVICGSPNLDHLPRQTGQVHPLLQKRLGIRPGDPWVLAATSGPGHRISHRHHRIVIEQLQRLSRALPDVPVVVKLHRKDRLDYYRKALRDCDGTRLVVVAEETYGFPRDIFEWLQGCSAVLTGASMVAVEAMLMDVPVVTMDFCAEVRDVDFIDFGATTHVTTAGALEGTVREILAAEAPCAEVNAAVHTYLKAAFHSLDYSSSQRGVEALRDIIRDRKRRGPC
jgi:hypothetical protein